MLKCILLDVFSRQVYPLHPPHLCKVHCAPAAIRVHVDIDANIVILSDGIHQ